MVLSWKNSFPGFSLLLREKTLVATGHEEMCVNKLGGGGRSSNRSSLNLVDWRIMRYYLG